MVGSEVRKAEGYPLYVRASVVNADYCGPVGVVLFNLGPADFVVEAGDRVT